MLYLAPYEGKGTTKDPCRPVGTRDRTDWSAIDLRPDASKLDGLAFVRLVDAPADRRLTKIGDHHEERFSARARSRAAGKLKHDPGEHETVADWIAHVLLRPPPKGWNRLAPTGDHYEVHLGELIWSSPMFQGASATDNFNRANETPIAAPWTKSGSGQNFDLFSNQIRGTTGGDGFYYYSGAAVTADQYSQITTIVANTDAGPACRISGTNITGYFAEFATDGGILKHIAGSATVVQALTVSYGAGDTGRLEVQGSTLRQYKNGAQVLPSGTDTSIPGAGAGVGFFDFFGSSESFDNWAGGDLEYPVPVAWFRA